MKEAIAGEYVEYCIPRNLTICLNIKGKECHDKNQ